VEFSRFLTDVLRVEDVGARFEGKVTYHDACHSLRELGIKDGPRRLLSHVQGLELREMDIPEECCGFGGTFSVKFPGVSGGMARTKIDSILRTGADTLVSADSSCLMQMAGAMSKAGVPIRTMHLAEVAGEPLMSTGLDHENFTGTIATTLADPHLQKAVYTATGRLMSHRRSAIAPDLLPDYQELREQARRVKLHTIENLDWYLEEFERNVVAHGGHVHWCRNAEEVAETVLRIARPRGVKLIVNQNR